MINKATVIITHHALSGTHHTVKDVDMWHKDRWPEFKSRRGYNVGYHYVIDWDGTLTQTRDHDEEGAHTIGMNTSSIGVCFMGNFDNHLPSPEQLKTWTWLYSELKELPTFSHRKYTNKSCHGSLLSDDYFQDHYQKTKLIDTLRQLIAKLTQLLTRRRMK